MKNQQLVKRYTHGLVNALVDEQEFRRVHGEIEVLGGLIKSHEELDRALSNPLLNARKKAGIILDVLNRMGFEKKTNRFISLLVAHGRLGLMADILAAAPEAWNQKRGVQTFEVLSVIPLADDQKERLRAELERLEKKDVSLVFRIDPEIIGGLSLRKGHIVYDASVEGDLLKLKGKIQEG